MIVALVLVAVVVVLIHAFLTWTNGYWRRRGVPQLEPKLIFGDFRENILGKQGTGDVYLKIYNAYPDKPWVGAYSFMSPQLVLRDPDIIKDILTTHFNSIHDNDFQIPDDVDPLLSRDPFFVTGELWKRRRAFFTTQLTPAKVKSLFPKVLQVLQHVNKHITAKGHQKGVGKGMEVKELTSKFMIDVVAAAAFGLEGQCFEMEDSFFRVLARNLIAEMNLFGVLGAMLISVSPKLAVLLGMKIINKEAERMIRTVVKEQIEIRRKSGLSTTDFMSSLLAKQQQGSPDCKTEDDIAGFLTLFFIEGFEAPANALAFILLEIARNPEVQTRLRDEITQKMPDGEIDYEAVINMEYLDQVFLEGFRMHPVAFALTKRVTKPIKLTSQTGDEVDLVVGDRLTIPVHALTKDPKQFSEPQNFDPSRFTAEGRTLWKKGAFNPFGDGPRACPGVRFTNAVLKSLIVNIVRNFHLELGSEMQYPFELKKDSFLYVAQDGVWLRFVKI